MTSLSNFPFHPVRLLLIDDRLGKDDGYMPQSIRARGDVHNILNMTTFDAKSRVSVHVFRDVENGDHFLKITEGCGNGVVLVDLSWVVGHEHLYFAITRALMAESQAVMKTKDLGSEIHYNLSVSCNINETIKQFSVKTESTDIALALIDKSEDQVQSMLSLLPEGMPISLCNFPFPGSSGSTSENLEPLKKFFKLSYEELEMSNIQDAVLTKIAVKDI